MRPYHLSAFLILLYWQLAPLPHPAVGGDGRVHWSVSAMAGRGTWEDASFDCDGNLTDSRAARYRDIGAKAEMTHGNLRITVAAGTSRYDSPSYNISPSGFAGGTSVGMQLAFEGPRTGMGAGIMTGTLGPVPNLYMRIGAPSHSHFRLDVRPLTETRAMSASVRMGIGFPKGFVGISFGPFVQKLTQATAFADLALPVNRHLDLRLAANAGPGIETSQWGLAGGLRLRL